MATQFLPVEQLPLPTTCLVTFDNFIKNEKVPWQGRTIERKHMLIVFHDFHTVHKRGNNISAACVFVFEKRIYKSSSVLWSSCLFIKEKQMFWNIVQVLSEDLFLTLFVQTLSNHLFCFLTCLNTCLNYSGRFPEGSHKRKSNNDDKHGHGKEKRRRPSTYAEGKKPHGW